VKPPETLLEFREWQRLGRFRTLREDCGFRGVTVAAALGVHHATVYRWEEGAGQESPHGPPKKMAHWQMYMRVIRGMINHMEVPERDFTGG
jgi:DNA-binding transcriptional regulator YiaG